MAIILVSCGGSGTTFPPPPPTGKFSDASLKGQYAFSMSGVTAGTCPADLSAGAYISRVGSFVADGNGNITAGLEDVLDLGSGQPAGIVSFTGGSYQIQANGRGVIVLQGASGGGLQLNLVMQSTTSGFLVQTDLCASTSGNFNLQTPADFSAAKLAGPYVFDFSGVSFAAGSVAPSVAPISMVGQIKADGNGIITGGVMDTHDGNVGTPSGATAVTPGTYVLDSSGNGTNFGRGTMTFNGRVFAFYIVDATHIKVLEEDTLGGTMGDAVQQAGTVPTQNSGFTGSFVYLVGGASVTGIMGPIARAARFTADGNGVLGTISLDDNNDGSYTHVSQGSNISAASYAIDTANAGSGRGTFTFTDSGAGTFSDVFYMISPTQAVVQETSAGIIGDGPLYLQTGGPFTPSGSAGNYVFNWSGVNLSPPPFEEDFIGQYALSSAASSNISGVEDYTQLGSRDKNLFTNVGIAGTFTINGDGTGANTFSVVNGNPLSATFNFAAYYANQNTVLMLCTDNTRVTAGLASRQ